MAQNIRWGWMKAMYIYTIAGAGAFGLGIIIAPQLMQSIFGWPCQDPIVFGISGSCYLGAALVCILGLRAPLKFAPILLYSLVYKVIWFAGVTLPLVLKGEFPTYGILHIVIFASYVIGDLIAIPFPYLFDRQSAVRAQPAIM